MRIPLVLPFGMGRNRQFFIQTGHRHRVGVVTIGHFIAGPCCFRCLLCFRRTAHIQIIIAFSGQGEGGRHFAVLLHRQDGILDTGFFGRKIEHPVICRCPHPVGPRFQSFFTGGHRNLRILCFSGCLAGRTASGGFIFFRIGDFLGILTQSHGNGIWHIIRNGHGFRRRHNLSISVPFDWNHKRRKRLRLCLRQVFQAVGKNLCNRPAGKHQGGIRLSSADFHPSAADR